MRNGVLFLSALSEADNTFPRLTFLKPSLWRISSSAEGENVVKTALNRTGLIESLV